jgi:hypothetical protein
MPISNKALPMSRCREKTEARNPQGSLIVVRPVLAGASFLDRFILCSSLKAKVNLFEQNKTGAEGASSIKHLPIINSHGAGNRAEVFAPPRQRIHRAA